MMDAELVKVLITAITTLAGSRILPRLARMLLGHNGNNVLSKDIYTLWRESQKEIRAQQKEIDYYRDRYYRALRRMALSGMPLNQDEKGELDLGPETGPITGVDLGQ